MSRVKPKWRSPLLVIVVLIAIGATMVAPAKPPVGGSWGGVIGAVIAGGVGLGGLALGWYGGSMLYVGYSLRNQDPDSAVHAADGGPVQIEGTARPHEKTLTAPVTGQECLAHTYAVQAKWGGGGGGTNVETTDAHDADSGETGPTWTDVAEGTEVVPFEVETDDGTVLVEGKPALKVVDDRTQKTVGGEEDPPEEIAAFVETPDIAAAPDSSIDLSEVDRDRTLRYTENLVVPGETVFVMGTGESTLSDSRDHAVDAVVKQPDEGLTARLPDRLWRYDFYVADNPMDEMLTAMRQVGALALATGGVCVAVAGYVLL